MLELPFMVLVPLFLHTAAMGYLVASQADSEFRLSLTFGKCSRARSIHRACDLSQLLQGWCSTVRWVPSLCFCTSLCRNANRNEPWAISELGPHAFFLATAHDKCNKHVHVCLYVYIYVCMYACMYACMFICICCI